MSFHLLLCLLQAKIFERSVRLHNLQFQVGICPCIGISSLERWQSLFSNENTRE